MSNNLTLQKNVPKSNQLNRYLQVYFKGIYKQIQISTCKAWKMYEPVNKNCELSNHPLERTWPLPSHTYGGYTRTIYPQFTDKQSSEGIVRKGSLLVNQMEFWLICISLRVNVYIIYIIFFILLILLFLVIFYWLINLID